jgi:hypothetical protein
MHFASLSSITRYAFARTEEFEIGPAISTVSRISSRDAPILSAACMW